MNLSLSLIKNAVVFKMAANGSGIYEVPQSRTLNFSINLTIGYFVYTLLYLVLKDYTDEKAK